MSHFFKYLSILTIFLTSYSSPILAKVSKKYAAIVIDGKTGTILHEDHAEDVRYPASLTKLMTLYIIFKKLNQKQLRLDDYVTISQHAANQPPTRCNFKYGEKVRVKDIISGMVVKSCNIGSVAMAEHISGSEKAFAAEMTREARRLGMNNTVFHNASGLHHANQVSTARDMALLARALYAYFPNHFSFFSLKNFHYKGMRYANHNKLLGRIDGVNGMKTGFTNPAGFNLIVSATRGNHRVISVVMGGDSGRWRDQKSAALLNEGFKVLGGTRSDPVLLDSTFPYKKKSGKTYRHLIRSTGFSFKENIRPARNSQNNDTAKNFRTLSASSLKPSAVRGSSLKVSPSRRHSLKVKFLTVNTKSNTLKVPFVPSKNKSITVCRLNTKQSLRASHKKKTNFILITAKKPFKKHSKRVKNKNTSSLKAA